MKVVIIGPAYPLRGGLAGFNERLARAFQEDGDEVHVVTFSLQYPNFLFPGKTQYSDAEPPSDLSIEVAINSVNPFNWWAVGNKISRMKPDLVICRFWLPFMGPCLGTILRRIKRNKHSKIVALIDNIIPHEKRIGDRLFAQYFVKPVDSFLVMSHSVEKELASFIKQEQKVIYVPHPVVDYYGGIMEKEASCTFLELPKEQPYILFFGFIRAYKGLDILLKALADSRIRNLGIKLIVAGEFYGSNAAYFDLIKEHQLDDLLILKTDFIPEAEVGYYFGAADLVVQPYKTATQSGISQLAFHYEVPMVVTGVGGLPEIVKDGKVGYVVEPNAPEQVADAIVDFYEQDKSSFFKEGVREDKRLYLWSTMINRIKQDC